MKSLPWDKRVYIKEMPPTFFEPDRSLAHDAFRETRNNIMRQFFYLVAEVMQQEHRAHVHPGFDIDSRVTVPPGRLVVFWPLPPADPHDPPNFDRGHTWMNFLFDSIYKALKNQDMRLHFCAIKPYHLGYDFLNSGVQLEFLIPSHWPELEMLPGPCNLYQLLQVLGRERQHAQQRP